MKFIADFFEKVKIYLNNEKHRKILQLTSESIKKLNWFLSRYGTIKIPQEASEIIDSISNNRIFNSYFCSEQWVTKYNAYRNNFEKAYQNFIQGVRKTNGIVDIDTIPNSDIKIKELFAEERTELTEALENIRKISSSKIDQIDKTDTYKNILPNILKNYSYILTAAESIQKYISEINTESKSLYKIANTLYGYMQRDGMDPKYMKYVFYLQEQINILTTVSTGLLSLNIIQAIPSIDKAIAGLYKIDVKSIYYNSSVK
jgi:hypothetical protein